MVGSMQREPFYTSGQYCVTQLGFYAGWVSHSESAAAEQVFFNERRDIAVLLAGECFPSSELMSGLRSKGHFFEDASGDWLPHLYEECGEQFFSKLNGLFSGVVVDNRAGKVFLFNDRYGMERLYFRAAGESFYFASEAKALLAVIPETREFDIEGVAQYLAFGCTLNGRTLFKGIQLLPPAACWCFESQTCRRLSYFSPEEWEGQERLCPEGFVEEFRHTLAAIVPRYFQSASAVGMSLTGGIDSRLVLAHLPAGVTPICYTFSGKDRDVLDARLAARLAQLCGYPYHILKISDRFLAEFSSYADECVHLTDGTLGVLGSHEIFYSELARHLSPVRVTGVFGGEIMRGVSFFKPLHLSASLMTPDMQSLIAGIAPPHIRHGDSPAKFAAFTEIPQRRFGGPAASRSHLLFRTPYLDNEFVALMFRAPQPSALRDPARALLMESKKQGLARLPTDRGTVSDKPGVAGSLWRLISELTFKLDYYESEGLPPLLRRIEPMLGSLTAGLRISGLHKHLHYRSWFQKELASLVTERVARASQMQSEIWNRQFLRGLARDHQTGRQNYLHEINAVLTLEAVERLLLNTKSRPPTRAETPLARVAEISR